MKKLDEVIELIKSKISPDEDLDFGLYTNNGTWEADCTIVDRTEPEHAIWTVSNPSDTPEGAIVNLIAALKKEFAANASS